MNCNLGRGGSGYGFRQQNHDEDEIEVLKDAIFIQNLPKNITRDDIQEAFSTVGTIKVKKF
jgi:RNA recognition motif-containing protein